MKTSRIKGLVWIAAVGVGGYLGYYVQDFLQRKGELEQMLPQEKQREVLDNVERPPVEENQVVDLRAVKAVFGREMDWTGKPPPPPPKVDPGPRKDPVVPKVAVADLLKVLYTQAHTREPELSRAWVSYVGPLARANEDLDNRLLHVGDALPQPHHAIQVKAITVDGVVFAFPEDEGREDEVVASLEFDDAGVLGIVTLAPGEVANLRPTGQAGIRRVTDPRPWVPGRSERIGKNEWQVGTKDLEEVGQDYARILTEDLRYRNFRNPKTGQIDGIQITDVRSGSIPANHGITTGEVLKSINGHKVTSVNDAIAFVKANAETTNTWVAVFAKQGREFTRVYRSPPR